MDMCPRDLHEMTEANIYRHNGYRQCIECKRDWQRKHQRKMRAAAKRLKELEAAGLVEPAPTPFDR